MNNIFQKQKFIQYKKRKSLPDFNIPINNKNKKLLSLSSNDTPKNKINTRKKFTSLKDLITYKNDNKESIYNNKSLVLNHTDNSELLELYTVDLKHSKKQSSFIKTLKNRILSPKCNNFSVKETENNNTKNNKEDTSFMSTNTPVNKKNISFNISYNRINNSFRKKKFLLKKTFTVDPRKIKKYGEDAITDKRLFNFQKTKKRKSKFSKGNSSQLLNITRKSYQDSSVKGNNSPYQNSFSKNSISISIDKKKFNRKKTIRYKINPNIINDEDIDEPSEQSLSQEEIEEKIVKDRKEEKQIEYQQLFHNNDITNNNSKFKDMITCKKIQKSLKYSIINFRVDDLKKEMYEIENNDITDAINKLPENISFVSQKISNFGRSFIIKPNMGHKAIKELLFEEKFRQLVHKGYVYDSFDDEESEDDDIDYFYFEPDCNFLFTIDGIICISSFIIFLYQPLYLSESLLFCRTYFNKDIIFYFIDVMFIADLLISFFRAYYNFEEYLIKNTTMICKNYLHSWFLFDLIESIPIFTFIKTKENKCMTENKTEDVLYYSAKLNNIYYLFVFVKVLKMYKIFKDNIFLNKLSEYINKIKFIDNWGNVFSYAMFLFFSLHFGACIFIFIGRNCYPSWIETQNIQNENFGCIYVSAIYYLITTMTTVGYGDIAGTTLTERIFQTIILIAGTCVYSWIVSSVSNYIQKMNNRSLKYENRLKIIEEIKLKNSSLSEELYEKILRVLQYRKYYEEIDKNTILDLLPYSLKNALIVQMYKSIIENFIFFRKLEHPNFLAQVVTLWKPLLFIKGDILVNEGDFIEEIIFNKSGVLSLEVQIELNNIKEFIEDYLIEYDLVKKNKINDNNNNKKNDKTSLIKRRSSILNVSYKHLPDYNYTAMNASIISNNDFLKRDTEFKKSDESFQFIRIINIRKNEHFGDVLMFLNQRSPLYVKVRSRKVELFLLKKMDAVNISSLYPNIWQKINRKSLFNMKQIRNLIVKKITVFCNSNGIKSELIHSKKQTINYLMPIPSPKKELKVKPLGGSTLTQKLNNNLKDLFNLENQKNSIILNTNENKIIYEEEKEESRSSSNNSKIENINKKNKSEKKINKVNNERNLNKISNFGFENEANTTQFKTKAAENNFEAKKSDNKIKKLKSKKNKNIDGSNNSINSKKFVNNKLKDSKSENMIKEEMNYIPISNNKFSDGHSLKTQEFNKEIYLHENTDNSEDFNINNEQDNDNNYEKITIISKENKKGKIIKNKKDSDKTNDQIEGTSIIKTKSGKKSSVRTDINNSQKSKKKRNKPKNNPLNDYINQNVNDEIYQNENFNINTNENILIPKISSNTLSNNLKTLSEITSQKQIINNLNIVDVNFNGSIPQEHKQIIQFNNSFKNISILRSSILEIPSSYKNINEITNYQYIKNENLKRQTEKFLEKKCGIYISSIISNDDDSLSERNEKKSNKIYKSKSGIFLHVNYKKSLSIKSSRNKNKSKKKETNNKNSCNCVPLEKKYYKNNNKEDIKNSNYLENSKKFKNNENKLSNITNYLTSNITNTIGNPNNGEVVMSRNSCSFGENTFQFYDKGTVHYINRKTLGDISSICKKNITKKKRNQLEVISETIENDSLALNDPTNFYAGLFNRLKNKKDVIPNFSKKDNTSNK